MDMIIAPLPFRRQKGEPIVACRAEACGAASRRDEGPTLGEPTSKSWTGAWVDGWAWMGGVDGDRGWVRTGERASERVGG